HVESFGIVDAAELVDHRDDFGPHFVEKAGGVRADVAEPLQGDGGAFDLFFHSLQHGGGDDGHAAAGGFLASFGPVQFDRLAGDAGRAEAVELLVLVHVPGHDLGVGAHVGSGDVLVGPDHVVDFVDEAAGEPLQ